MKIGLQGWIGAATVGLVLWPAGCDCDTALGMNGDADDVPDGDAGRTYLDDPCGNGFDDDGDGRIDEDCFCVPGETQPCWTGTLRQRGVGACGDGLQTCEGPGEWGTWGECVGAATPAEETCGPDGTGDGVDNDCDGAPDDGCACAEGESRLCGGEFPDLGVCSGGTQSCVGGTWSVCEDAVWPELERCDDLDNDCDGVVDEGVCDCTPTEPTLEGACSDGLDNDCDTQTDCFDPDCRGGLEVCGDRLDNDCDGQTDEGCDCVPVPEVCGDGIDNDCDGATDEGCGPVEGCPGTTVPDFRDRIEWVKAIPGALYDRTNVGNRMNGGWLGGPTSDVATVQLRGTFTFAGTPSTTYGSFGRLSFHDGTPLSLAPRLEHTDFWDMSEVDVTGTHFVVAGTFIGSLNVGFATWTSSPIIYTTTPPGPAPDLFWAARPENEVALAAGEHYGAAGIPPHPEAGSFYPWMNVQFAQADEAGNVFWGGDFSGTFEDDGHAIDSTSDRPITPGASAFQVSAGPSGTTRWARSWYTESGSQGEVDPGGNYLVRRGNLKDGTNRETLELLDARTGTTLFHLVREPPGVGLFVCAPAVDRNGNVLVAGETAGTAMTLGPLTVGANRGYVASFTSGGALRWSRELLDTSSSLRGNRSYRLRSDHGQAVVMLGLNLGPSSYLAASTTLPVAGCPMTIEKRWYPRSPDTGVPSSTPPSSPFDVSTYAEVEEVVLFSFEESSGSLRWVRRVDTLSHLNNSFDIHPSGDLLLVLHGCVDSTAPTSYGDGLVRGTHVMRLSGH